MNLQQMMTLAVQHHAAGRLPDAEAIYRQILAQQPNHAPALGGLGFLAFQAGQSKAAIALIERAISIDPNSAESRNNLGLALAAEGQLDRAIAEYQMALQLKPRFIAAHCNLGIALRKAGQLERAAAHVQTAAALDPAIDLTSHFGNLANAYWEVGLIDQAIHWNRRIIDHKPSAKAYNNLIYSLYFHPDYDMPKIGEQQRLWAERYARPLETSIRPHTNDRDPERKLRIGYVSPDFRDHVVGRNLLPLLAHHDHERFKITCYSTVLSPDSITRQFEEYADQWRISTGLSDAELAEQIRADQIDILVDLTLHMAQNRLLVFAQKPAPVQVSFAGYPGTTGLSTMDYRLTDPYLDPEGSDDAPYSEKSIRLPHSFWCYDPLSNTPAVNELPALSNGFVTFGSLNNFSKVNTTVLQLWAQVLEALPDSKMLILCNSAPHWERALEQLKQFGLKDPSRVSFLPKVPRAQYMEYFHQIDLALDSFPYNGHTTSLDGLWMGVPMISLIGKTVVGRAGFSQLSNLGLERFVASSPEEYVQIAIRETQDLTRLAQLRSGLRTQMESSPLMDAPRFARDIKNAYRTMWQRWCGADTLEAG